MSTSRPRAARPAAKPAKPAKPAQPAEAAPAAAAAAPQPSGRRVDLTKVVHRLTDQVAELTQQNTVLQVIVEDQEELITGLQAELVTATSGTADTTSN